MKKAKQQKGLCSARNTTDAVRRTRLPSPPPIYMMKSKPLPSDRSRTLRRPRPMPSADADRITPVRAAEVMCLGYPEQLNIVRWSLEEAFDPATGVTIPMPDTLRIPLLTSSQERRLGDARAAYRESKAARIAWTSERWMRVPMWGGRAAPGGEYRYSEARCRDWHARSLGKRVEVGGSES